MPVNLPPNDEDKRMYPVRDGDDFLSVSSLEASGFRKIQVVAMTDNAGVYYFLIGIGDDKVWMPVRVD